MRGVREFGRLPVTDGIPERGYLARAAYEAAEPIDVLLPQASETALADSCERVEAFAGGADVPAAWAAYLRARIVHVMGDGDTARVYARFRREFSVGGTTGRVAELFESRTAYGAYKKRA
jgi:hypothetical protein